MKTATKPMTLAALSRAAAKKAAWLKKLHLNCSPKLNKIKHLFALTPSSLKPNDDKTITLVYIGEAKNFDDFATSDLRKLSNAFETLINANLVTPVRFKRITLNVKIKLPFDLPETIKMAA